MICHYLLLEVCLGGSYVLCFFLWLPLNQTSLIKCLFWLTAFDLLHLCSRVSCNCFIRYNAEAPSDSALPLGEVIKVYESTSYSNVETHRLVVTNRDKSTLKLRFID
mgnify:CR=1 FL=1